MSSGVRVFLDGVRDGWLQQCGSCDAGLAMSCTCPPGDPRNVIEKLAAAVEAVFALADEADGCAEYEYVETGFAAIRVVYTDVIRRAVAAHLDPKETER